MKIGVFFLLFFSFPLFAAEDVDISRRVYNHLIVHDINSASEEAQKGLQAYPESKSIYSAYIKTLAESGDEKKMLEVWKQFFALFPEEAYHDELLETMAWGIIQKGADSPSPLTRVIALLVALFSRDIKGINILHANLHNQSNLIRGVTVQLSATNFDDKLRDEMLDLLQTEKNWQVRLEVIKAMGKMRHKQSKDMLEDILSDAHSHAEEKAVAIQSLVGMLDKVDRQYIEKLTQTDRAGLRLLACQAIQQFDCQDDLDLIYPLFQDPHPDVRKAAIMTLGILRTTHYRDEPVDAFAGQFLQDTDPSVAIAAAWVIMLNNPKKGGEALSQWFTHQNPDIRRLAVSALVASGKYGLPLIQEEFKTTSDPYVKMNLALGLISQRCQINEACQAIYQGISTIKDKWMWEENGPFLALAPSKIKHQDLIPQLPEATNQSTRLDILNILAIMKFDKAPQAIKAFLSDCTDDMTGVASALLLTEGDEDALQIVKDLLNDKDDKVRIHAALILALWGREESIIQLLQSKYPSSSRKQKEQILEGLGHIGSKSSLPFFVDTLNEPYQILRLISACGLIQCLNH